MLRIHPWNKFTTIKLTEDKLIKEIKNNVAYIWLNRPDKKNALDADVWFNLP